MTCKLVNSKVCILKRSRAYDHDVASSFIA